MESFQERSSGEPAAARNNRAQSAGRRVSGAESFQERSGGASAIGLRTLPPCTATSPTWPGWPVPSTMVTPRITRSTSSASVTVGAGATPEPSCVARERSRRFAAAMVAPAPSTLTPSFPPLPPLQKNYDLPLLCPRDQVTHSRNGPRRRRSLGSELGSCQSARDAAPVPCCLTLAPHQAYAVDRSNALRRPAAGSSSALRAAAGAAGRRLRLAAAPGSPQGGQLRAPCTG